MGALHQAAGWSRRPLPDGPRGCTRSGTFCEAALATGGFTRGGGNSAVLRCGGRLRLARAEAGVSRRGSEAKLRQVPAEGLSPPRVARCEEAVEGSSRGPQGEAAAVRGCHLGPRGLRVRRMALEF